MEREGAVIVTCQSCLMLDFLPEEQDNYICAKCNLVGFLDTKLQRLEEQLAALQHITHQEPFLNTPYQGLLEEAPGDTLQHIIEQEEGLDTGEQNTLDQEVTGEVTHEAVRGSTQEPDIWRHVTRRTRRNRHPSAPLELHNRFDSLSLTREDVEHQIEQQGQSSEIRQEVSGQLALGRVRPDPQKKRVVVVGDSLLRGTEAVVCGPDKLYREVCCLPGAKIRDVTDRVMRLTKPTDRNPFFLIHVGTNDTARRRCKDIIRDYQALGRKLKELNAQVVISSLLPVEGHGPGRERKIVELNHWLRSWCRQERFGFLDHGMLFQEEGLLAADGLHLTPLGKDVFARSLAKHIGRALN